MALTLEQVRHIARLARLSLTSAEEERYQEQLSDILDYAERLQAVDTAHLPATARVFDRPAPLRDDEVRPCLSREDILANAPEAEQGMFRVPPVLDTEG